MALDPCSKPTSNLSLTCIIPLIIIFKCLVKHPHWHFVCFSCKPYTKHINIWGWKWKASSHPFYFKLLPKKSPSQKLPKKKRLQTFRLSLSLWKSPKKLFKTTSCCFFHVDVYIWSSKHSLFTYIIYVPTKKTRIWSQLSSWHAVFFSLVLSIIKALAISYTKRDL